MLVLAAAVVIVRTSLVPGICVRARGQAGRRVTACCVESSGSAGCAAACCEASSWAMSGFTSTAGDVTRGAIRRAALLADSAGPSFTIVKSSIGSPLLRPAITLIETGSGWNVASLVKTRGTRDSSLQIVCH